jgi:rhamnosyltransferase
MEKTRVFVVIVLYYPNEAQLVELINSCLQTTIELSLLLFDNAKLSPGLRSQLTSKKLIYYQSLENVGVGGAHYYACESAVAEKCDFILFLDQDSQLPANFIEVMQENFQRLQRVYSRLAAIGPTWYDPRRSRIRRKKLMESKRAADILISSGMLVSVPALKVIGNPKKAYIIDHVDTEWCIRAISKKFQVIKLHTVSMQHNVGEIKNIGRFKLGYHPPIRYYYRIRNGFFIFRDANLVLSLRMYVLLINLFGLLKLPFLPKPLASLYAVLQGVREGLGKKLDSL